jgi:hypothetical protein
VADLEVVEKSLADEDGSPEDEQLGLAFHKICIKKLSTIEHIARTSMARH